MIEAQLKLLKNNMQETGSSKGSSNYSGRN
jgi:hypothetical protein